MKTVDDGQDRFLFWTSGFVFALSLWTCSTINKLNNVDLFHTMVVVVDKERACLRLMMLGSGGVSLPKQPKKEQVRVVGPSLPQNTTKWQTHPNISHILYYYIAPYTTPPLRGCWVLLSLPSSHQNINCTKGYMELCVFSTCRNVHTNNDPS